MPTGNAQLLTPGPHQNAAEDAIGFLQVCLRSRWDAAALPAARALAGEHDHRSLVEIARAEGVAPLLYSVVREQGLVPPSAEQALRAAYYASAARSLLLFHELGSILHGLATAGLAVLLLKGAALAQAIYGNPALRPMGDLDLLVRREDVPTAVAAMAALGYTRVRAEPWANATTATENELLLCKPGRSTAPLELHWSLLDSPYYQQKLDMQWFWQTALPIQVEGTSALMLGPEAQVLHLCAHLVLHHSNGDELRLLWLHDLAEVVACYRERMDWELLLDRAQRYDLLLPLQQVLARLAGTEWCTPIPGAVLAQLQDLSPSRQERQVYSRMTAARRPVARRFWDDLASTSGWRQRLRFAWGNLFPAPAYMRQRYHISHGLLLPLYYPYRWFLGARSALCRRGRRKPDADRGATASEPGP